LVAVKKRLLIPSCGRRGCCWCCGGTAHGRADGTARVWRDHDSLGHAWYGRTFTRGLELGKAPSIMTFKNIRTTKSVLTDTAYVRTIARMLHKVAL
jgi:hypothetical protein